MPFDPAKPADHAPLSSAEMRGQLNALNQTIGDTVNAAIAGTSNNSNGVGTMGQGADGSYQQWQMQMLFDKLDELINALRR